MRSGGLLSPIRGERTSGRIAHFLFGERYFCRFAPNRFRSLAVAQIAGRLEQAARRHSGLAADRASEDSY